MSNTSDTTKDGGRTAGPGAATGADSAAILVTSRPAQSVAGIAQRTRAGSGSQAPG